MNAIETTIRTAATRRLGAVDVSIVRTVERYTAEQLAAADGTYYGLSLLIDGERKFVGRRSSKTELLTLCNTLTPEQVDGKSFTETGKPHKAA